MAKKEDVMYGFCIGAAALMTCTLVFFLGLSLSRQSQQKAEAMAKSTHITCYSGGDEIFFAMTEGPVLRNKESGSYVILDMVDGRIKEAGGDCVVSVPMKVGK